MKMLCAKVYSASLTCKLDAAFRVNVAFYLSGVNSGRRGTRRGGQRKATPGMYQLLF